MKGKSEKYYIAEDLYKKGYMQGFKDGERSALQIAEMFCEDESRKRVVFSEKIY